MRNMLVYPIDDEAIGRKQPQHMAVFNRLKGSNPRVELLLRQFGFQLSKTAMP